MGYDKEFVTQVIIKNLVQNDFKILPKISNLIKDITRAHLQNVDMENGINSYETMTWIIDNMPRKSPMKKPLAMAQEESISSDIIKMNKETVERIEKEENEINSVILMSENLTMILNEICVECGWNRREMVILPCRHVVLCRSCTMKRRIVRCPSCKQVCDRIIKVYF